MSDVEMTEPQDIQIPANILPLGSNAKDFTVAFETAIEDHGGLPFHNYFGEVAHTIPVTFDNNDLGKPKYVLREAINVCLLQWSLQETKKTLQIVLAMIESVSNSDTTTELELRVLDAEKKKHQDFITVSSYILFLSVIGYYYSILIYLGSHKMSPPTISKVCWHSA